MNRRERRAEWLARHRGDAVAGRVAAGARREQQAPANAERHTQARPRLHLGGRDAARGGTSPASVSLHIEEVVLHGFDPRGRYAVADAVQHELTRLLTERGVPPTLGEARGAARLDAGSFHPARDTRPQGLGAQLARAVYRGLKG